MTEEMIDPRMVEAVRSATLFTPMFRIRFIPMRSWPYGRYEYFYNGQQVVL